MGVGWGREEGEEREGGGRGEGEVGGGGEGRRGGGEGRREDGFYVPFFLLSQQLLFSPSPGAFSPRNLFLHVYRCDIYDVP